MSKITRTPFQQQPPPAAADHSSIFSPPTSKSGHELSFAFLPRSDIAFELQRKKIIFSEINIFYYLYFLKCSCVGVKMMSRWLKPSSYFLIYNFWVAM